MRRQSNSGMTVVWLAVVVGILPSGGRTKADFTFGEPVNLGPNINTSAPEMPTYISPDGLVMYLNSLDRPGGYGGWDLWLSTRETLDDDWQVPVNLGSPLNTAQDECQAYLSADGLELYFPSTRSGGYGFWDLWMARRSGRDADWDAPQNLGPVINSSAAEGGPWLSPDGLELYYYIRTREGGYGNDDIWVSRRSTLDSAWGAPENLGPAVNSSASERLPFVSSNGLFLLFSDEVSIRPGGFGDGDLWMARRWSLSDPWNPPFNLGPMVNTVDYDGYPRLSLDDSMLYFCSERPGGFGGLYGDIYQAPIIPVVDFNGDGNVDGKEVLALVDHWGQNEPSCDIGPTPMGDGVVNLQDLMVLAEHIGKDVCDPTLANHWAFDETEGDAAHDSIGDNHATVLGGAVWQPTEGMVDGALFMDGIDDFVATGGVPHPDGPMTVLAWVKGGRPGQVILSQFLGTDWLMADPSDGHLLTDLKASGRSARALVSETAITDGNWHRVGLVWDGTNRMLYVDDEVVAADTQPDLVGSNGGLNIGCDKNQTPGTYWTGLIDDVRIYNRAARP